MSDLRLVSPHPSQIAALNEACLRAFQGELPYIVRSLQRLGATSFEMEDLAQDVFIALRGSWHRYDVSRPLRPYLFGIVFRVVSAHKRKWSREVPRELSDYVDDKRNPDEALEVKQARAMVLAALERLPLPRRAVVVMHDIDEVPVVEIASALKIPLFTVYSRLRKGRIELGTALRRLAREGAEPHG